MGNIPLRPGPPRRDSDQLAIAKGILESAVEPDDLGDFELAEVTARATVALADAVERLAKAFATQPDLVDGVDKVATLLENGRAHIQVSEFGP